jgi:hypothetical protein
MRHHQFTLNHTISRQNLCKLPKPKRSQHTHNIRIVRKVKIELLIQRKCIRVVVQSHVDLGNGRVNGMVGKSGQDLLHVTDSDCAAGW